MKIKFFLVAVYTAAGLGISAFTAFMTFVIIGVPIGVKMTFHIVLTILSVLPVIILISYFLGRYLSKKFNFIDFRLENIKQENFTKVKTKNFIYEIGEIEENINFLSNRLDTLINRLKEKNQNLSDLLVSMAHDIKTPITVLNGYIEEMEDGLVAEKDLQYTYERMKTEIRFIDELTVDMLDFISSLSNHRERSEIELYTFIENEILPMLPNRKDILYINEVEENFICSFNRVDLKKICLNILNNAVKHTEKGYIKVGINNQTVIFENSGKEIPLRYRDKIFEPFFTVSKSKNRKKSGFGLGLSIVKNLSKNNGYRCYLKSSDRYKTVFCLEKGQTDFLNKK